MYQFNTAYYHVPPRERAQAIAWLEAVKSDCEAKIRHLQSLDKQDQRHARHMQNMNDLADLFDTAKNAARDKTDLIYEINTRLNCGYERAVHIYHLLQKRITKRQRRRTHAAIIRAHKDGETVTAIAKRSGVSRQTVYTVLSREKENRIL